MSHSAVTSTSGFFMKMCKSCVPRFPTPMKPMRTRAFDPCARSMFGTAITPAAIAPDLMKSRLCILVSFVNCSFFPRRLLSLQHPLNVFAPNIIRPFVYPNKHYYVSFGEILWQTGVHCPPVTPTSSFLFRPFNLLDRAASSSLPLATSWRPVEVLTFTNIASVREPSAFAVIAQRVGARAGCRMPVRRRHLQSWARRCGSRRRGCRRRT